MMMRLPRVARLEKYHPECFTDIIFLADRTRKTDLRNSILLSTVKSFFSNCVAICMPVLIILFYAGIDKIRKLSVQIYTAALLMLYEVIIEAIKLAYPLFFHRLVTVVIDIWQNATRIQWQLLGSWKNIYYLSLLLPIPLGHKSSVTLNID